MFADIESQDNAQLFILIFLLDYKNNKPKTNNIKDIIIMVFIEEENVLKTR